MKIKGIIGFFVVILIFLLATFSCATSSSEVEEKTEVLEGLSGSENTEIVESSSLSKEDQDTSTQNIGGETSNLPTLQQKSTYFEFIDPLVMKDAEIGSPQSIRNVISKIRKPDGKYSEEEAVLLAVLYTVMTTVWTSETVTFSMPDYLPENVYTGIIEYIGKGIFDTNAGKTDFYTLVLPCVILCTSSQTSYFADAEINLLEALEKNKDSVLAHYLLGLLYKAQKNSEKSFYHFEQAYNLDSSVFEVAFEYAKSLYDSKIFDKAFEIAVNLKNPEDTNLDLLELCGKAALAINQLDIAESYVGKLLQKEPDNSENILLRAEILFNKGEYLKVSSLLDVYAKTEKTARKYLLLRSQLQNLWNRNITAAISTISEALQLYPTDYEVLLYAAELASESGNKINGLAASDLIKPLKELDSENPRILQIEIDEYIRQNQWNEAYEVIEKLIKISPTVEARLSYISICIELGNVGNAYTMAKELFEENPENENIQLAYIKALIANNKADEASILIDNLLQTATSKMKSALYYQRSRIEKSDDKKLSSLRSSLTANPRNEEALFALYQLYFNKNDYRKAQYYLKQVIALNPSNQELLELNKELESYLY